ncbi:MAG: serine/threonine-protein kinase [Verrucomicrobiales bacterium]|nr:serine/threonine-protein kinase [Verrucomicrobiales bacterium]
MDSESKEIITNLCPECEQDIDVTSLSPFSKISCPFCEKAVRVRTRLGQYEITGPLGEGGMSQVFSARDVTLGRQVALKILHQELSQDEKLRLMFEREAQLTASINHPNVVKVYTVGYESGYFYIAMELVDATSVEQIIAEEGAQSEEKVLRMAYDVVSGLKAAYQLNLIHRDIKPGNILVTKDGTAKLVDFGLAVAQGGADENEDIWATPFYVPPEKLVRETDTYLGDIYALGATCYHAIAGQPPFHANTSSLEELIAIKSEGVDLKSVAPQASVATVKLIESMMAHSASSRPSSYDTLLQKIYNRQHEIGLPLQASSHSVKNRSKGFVLKAGIGAAAMIVLSLFFVQKAKVESPASELGALFANTGDRVISVAEKEAAAKMLAGRSAMVKGKLSEARKIFRDLEGNKNFTQPTMAWNTFNQGLVELLIGNEKPSRVAFGALQKQTGFSASTQDSYKTFFDSMGSVLSSPLPVLRADVLVDSTTFESIGLLAAGLKNWEMGQFEEANIFFKDFSRIQSPESDQWIEEMIPIVEKYQADLELFESLPNPSQNMDLKALRTAKEKLEKAEDNLKTRSEMKRLVKARIERANDFIKKASAPPPKPKADPNLWTEAETAELTHLQALVSSLPDYKENYLFSGAVIKLNEIKMETPKGKALQQDLVNGYKAAERFIPGLAERLQTESFTGVVRRKKGVPLDASVKSLSAETFIVDLGFGPNEVGIDEFAPSWLVEAAEQSIGEPSQANLDSLKEAFWFANVCGMSNEANRVAAKIIEIDQSFKDEGKRFRKINFAALGSQ